MDKNLIDQIRHANDIVEVIQSYLPLKKVGMNWRGLCPFHNDTNPSLSVSQPKQIYKCFACGKAGNVFGFVQDYEKIPFMEAVKKLAARAGIAMPEYQRTKVVSTKRQQLLAVYKSAAEFYKDSLFNYGEEVLSYLAKRSISKETARELDLGYALPSQRGLLNHLLKEGFGTSLLRESGLFKEIGGGLNDHFRGRLMFPIHDSLGEIIAFGGRLMENQEGIGKYINSPGTELYTKGKELYGLHKTKYNISKANYAIICEGYFDFLRLYENGLDNCVASLGTALTEDQVFLLRRFSRNILMLYDGDEAGIKAAVRGGLICLSKGMNVKIAVLPEKEDPDGYLLKYGREKLVSLIAKAPKLINFMAMEKAMETPVKERIELILDAARGLDDAISTELLIKEVSEAFGITVDALLSSLKKGFAKRVEKAEDTQAVASKESLLAEKIVLVWALKDSEHYKQLAQELNTDYFKNKVHRQIFELILKLAAEDLAAEPAAILDETDDEDLKSNLAELLFDDWEEIKIRKHIDDLKLHKLRQDLAELDAKLANEPDNEALQQERHKKANEFRKMTSAVLPRLRSES